MKAANSLIRPSADDLDLQRGVESAGPETDLEPMIRAGLTRILCSRAFCLSTRMQRFLRFVVETTLEGRADYLKEYVIGTEVYDRKPPYEPSQDSIVRTEARRLRGKLKEYYASEGKIDPLIISFRTGSYIPVFAIRERVNADRQTAERPVESTYSEIPEALVIVVMLDEVSGDTLVEDCARAISEGIALQLSRRSQRKPVADLPPPMPHLALVTEPYLRQNDVK